VLPSQALIAAECGALMAPDGLAGTVGGCALMIAGSVAGWLLQ
jgi:hypothetical protein